VYTWNINIQSDRQNRGRFLVGAGEKARQKGQGQGQGRQKIQGVRVGLSLSCTYICVTIGCSWSVKFARLSSDWHICSNTPARVRMRMCVCVHSCIETQWVNNPAARTSLFRNRAFLVSGLFTCVCTCMYISLFLPYVCIIRIFVYMFVYITLLFVFFWTKVFIVSIVYLRVSLLFICRLVWVRFVCMCI